jgi:hypothetical protein
VAADAKGDDGGEEALFETWDSHLFADIAAMGVGFAAVASGVGMSEATPDLLSFLPNRRSKVLPHRILLRADSHGIHLFASDRKSQRGKLVMEAVPGSFRASLHHNIGDVELLLFFKGYECVALTGKWDPFRRKAMRVAREVTEMGSESQRSAP